MAINFSNVNISLRQFHEIASGKYNAGDIKLTSETEIDKANNHVSTYMSWRYNREAIGAEEAVAVKEALIKALQRNGFTNEDKINEIRERIGLEKVAGESDVALESRRIKPLSRKEVREIFNANAREINECAKKVAGGFSDVLTNDQVLTQKHHQNLNDKDLFSRSRDAINSENEAKFMKRVVESDRAKLGEDVKALHSHYIDCIAAGRLDRLPPEFTEPIDRFIRDEMHMMIVRGFKPPAAKEALKLIGADRITRKLTALLEKQGRLNQYDLANAIRGDIQAAVKLQEFCKAANEQLKEKGFPWTKDEVSYGDDKFFEKNKSRIITPAFLLELRERGPVDEDGNYLFNVRFGDLLDNAENAGDITKELAKADNKHRLKYVLASSFVAKKLLIRMDAEELFTPEGVRNGIGRMLVGKFLDAKSELHLTDRELNRISKKFAPAILEKISDADIADKRSEILDDDDKSALLIDDVYEEFENFVMGKIGNELREYVAAVGERNLKQIYPDTAKIEYVNIVLGSANPGVYNVNALNTVANACQTELSRIERNERTSLSFGNIVKEPGTAAEKLDKIADVIANRLKANNVADDEESKEFRQMVSLVFLMLTDVNVKDMDDFEKVKETIGNDLTFGKKGWILFEAMERTSDRFPRAEKA